MIYSRIQICSNYNLKLSFIEVRWLAKVQKRWHLYPDPYSSISNVRSKMGTFAWAHHCASVLIPAIVNEISCIINMQVSTFSSIYYHASLTCKWVHFSSIYYHDKWPTPQWSKDVTLLLYISGVLKVFGWTFYIFRCAMHFGFCICCIHLFNNDMVSLNVNI